MQSAATRPLWPAFDLIKCACAVGMVLAHGLYWTWTVRGRFILPPESPWFTAFQWGMFLGVCPLALPFLAGAALRLRYAAPVSEHESGSILRTLALQSVVLAILGYLMNVLAAGWYDLWAWNVLQLIAVSFLLTGTLYLRKSVLPVAAFGLLVLALTDPLRDILPNQDRGALFRVILGDPLDWHQWPIFPWSATVAFGFVLADAYFRFSRDHFVWICTASGVLLTALAGALGRIIPAFDPKNLIGSQIMQPPVALVLGIVGVLLLVFASLTTIQSRIHFSRNGFVRCFSGGILWIYLIHMIIGVRVSYIILRYFDYNAIVMAWSRDLRATILIAFPALLLLPSWAVGYCTIVWLHDKRVSIRLRRVEYPRA